MSDRRPGRAATQSRRRLALLIVAAVCALAGAATIAAAMITDTPAPPQSTGFGSPTSTAEPSAPTRESASPSADATDTPTARNPKPSRKAVEGSESVPTKITIPGTGMRADFVSLDLTGDGELDTPKDPAQVGWFTGAHTPGGPGVAVVAGHVTWNGAEAAFFELGDLRQGDRVKINRKDGSTAIFAVERRDTFAKDSFPTEEVYRDSSRPELVLITCGGEFDADRHYYDSNVIVWAELVSIRS
jgi:hypothetical protein